jgi:hypothetical protein
MRSYIQFSGLIFAIVSVGHLLRVLRRWPLMIAGYPLPVLASLAVAVAAGVLAAWAWRLLNDPAAGGAAGSGNPPGR